MGVSPPPDPRDTQQRHHENPSGKKDVLAKRRRGPAAGSVASRSGRAEGTERIMVTERIPPAAGRILPNALGTAHSTPTPVHPRRRTRMNIIANSESKWYETTEPENKKESRV